MSFGIKRNRVKEHKWPEITGLNLEINPRNFGWFSDRRPGTRTGSMASNAASRVGWVLIWGYRRFSLLYNWIPQFHVAWHRQIGTWCELATRHRLVSGLCWHCCRYRNIASYNYHRIMYPQRDQCCCIIFSLHPQTGVKCCFAAIVRRLDGLECKIGMFTLSLCKVDTFWAASLLLNHLLLIYPASIHSAVSNV